MLVWAPENLIEHLTPTPLLFVTTGGYDPYHTLDDVQIAYRRAGEPKRLEILPYDVVGLYLEPGLGEAMKLAISWFDRYEALGSSAHPFPHHADDGFGEGASSVIENQTSSELLASQGFQTKTLRGQ
jgi:hypothetical protein